MAKGKAKTVYIDFETRSKVDLKKSGSDVYARDKSTDVLCLAYAVESDPVSLWAMGSKPPAELLEVMSLGYRVVGHNIGGFEVPIWEHVCHKKYGWPKLDIEQCDDTMVRAFAMSLPGSLDRAALAVGINHRKDQKGHRVMLQVSQPKDGGWFEPAEYPEKFKMLYEYCMQDVEVERELDMRLYPLSPSERNMWILDHKINQRGVRVDLESLSAAYEIVLSEQDRLTKNLQRVTGNQVATHNSHAQFKKWLEFKGVIAESIDKAAVTKLLEDKELDHEVKEALSIRQEAAKSSTAKFSSMIEGACTDGRMRGIFQFLGANTGRWAGRRAQLQNLPRPKLKHKDIEKIIGTLGGVK